MESIADNAFRECNALTNVMLCNKLRSIGSGAFIGCSALYDITVPESVESIGADGDYVKVMWWSDALPNTMASGVQIK